MIVCPNCNHLNPDAAVQCEACYVQLPIMNQCPNCGATVHPDAAFCGQCGYNLHSVNRPPSSPDPMLPPNPLEPSPQVAAPNPLPPTIIPPTLPVEALAPVVAEAPAPVVAEAPAPVVVEAPAPVVVEAPAPVVVEAPAPVVAEAPAPVVVEAPAPAPVAPGMTQLQQVNATLFHTQSNTPIELPQNLSVIHIGKPNEKIPPDVDVAGFANSEIVSRIHADIRIEGDSYYIEDVGSSNGTYINNSPLLPGNRHRLRAGDRISLGKGDLVTFLFQLA